MKNKIIIFILILSILLSSLFIFGCNSINSGDNNFSEEKTGCGNNLCEKNENSEECSTDCVKTLDFLETNEGNKIILSIKNIEEKDSVFSKTYGNKEWSEEQEHTPNPGNGFIIVTIELLNPNKKQLKSWSYLKIYAKDDSGRVYLSNQADFPAGGIVLETNEKILGRIVIEISKEVINNENILLYWDKVNPRKLAQIN
jgi:hypothetical protein